MAVILDQASAQILDQGTDFLDDQSGGPVYALASFWWHNTAAGDDEFVIAGARRDPLDPVVTAYPAEFSASPAAPKVTGVLATYLAFHPAGP